jgi:hypothetical protein
MIRVTERLNPSPQPAISTHRRELRDTGLRCLDRGTQKTFIAAAPAGRSNSFCVVHMKTNVLF